MRERLPVPGSGPAIALGLVLATCLQPGTRHLVGGPLRLPEPRARLIPGLSSVQFCVRWAEGSEQ